MEIELSHLMPNSTIKDDGIFIFTEYNGNKQTHLLYEILAFKKNRCIIKILFKKTIQTMVTLEPLLNNQNLQPPAHLLLILRGSKLIRGSS